MVMSRNATALIDGAMKGYNFVDGIYRRNERDVERKEDRANQAEDRKLRLGDADTARTNASTDRETAETERKRQTERQKVSDGYAKKSHEQQNTQFELGVKKEEKLTARLDASALLDVMQKDKNYKLTDSDKETYKNFITEVESNGDDAVKFNIGKLSSGIQGYLSGKNKGAINSPEFVGAFNKIFAKKINKNYGVGNSPIDDPDGTIVKKEVKSFMPGKKPGTIVIELLVTAKDKEGKTYQYTAPATTDRANGDQVSQIPVEQIMGDIKTRAILTDDTKRKQLVQHLQGIVIRGGGKPKEQYTDPVQLGAGYVQYDSENKARGISGLRGYGGRGGSAPSDQKMIQFLMSDEQGLSAEEAREYVKNKASLSVQDLAAKFFQNYLKLEANNGIEGDALEALKAKAVSDAQYFKRPQEDSQKPDQNPNPVLGLRQEGQDPNSLVDEMMGG